MTFLSSAGGYDLQKKESTPKKRKHMDPLAQSFKGGNQLMRMKSIMMRPFPRTGEEDFLRVNEIGSSWRNQGKDRWPHHQKAWNSQPIQRCARKIRKEEGKRAPRRRNIPRDGEVSRGKERENSKNASGGLSGRTSALY